MQYVGKLFGAFQGLHIITHYLLETDNSKPNGIVVSTTYCRPVIM